MATAIDIAHVEYQVPNLDLMERFMTDFGLRQVQRDETTLRMGGAGRQHHLHISRQGSDARFLGAAFEVSSQADLDALASLPGSSAVEAVDDAAGGGWQVRMTMPDGFEISAIYGRASNQAALPRHPHALNDLLSKPRVNESLRMSRRPCDAIRLGHFVLHVSDHDASVAWIQERFGMLPSDHFLPPGQDGPIVGTFLRFNRGEQLVDHHALLILQSDWIGVHHCSFEVLDLDAVMTAHDYLLAQGWTLDCGVGRHLMGSQIFDYWKDPFGFRVEHYTDGDVVDASFQPGKFNGTASETTQWGDEPPLEFFS